jgi:hypothetical protein
MSINEQVLRDFRYQRAELQQQLEMLESGELRTGERRAPSTVYRDTTKESIERAKSHISILDTAIEELSSRLGSP